MTRYWIVVDNTHEGPFTAEELLAKQLPGDTYAWHPGLPKWTRISEIPEFVEIYAEKVEKPVESEITDDADVEIPVSEVVVETEEPRLRSTPPPPPTVNPVFEPSAATNPTQISCNDVENEKRPSSYLAWSIITTIMFFFPLGIVAIIYSSKVNSLWITGQRDKARKSSEMAAWFSNIAFVVGLIWIPFSVTISMIAA